MKAPGNVTIGLFKLIASKEELHPDQLKLSKIMSDCSISPKNSFC